MHFSIEKILQLHPKVVAKHMAALPFELHYAGSTDGKRS